MPKMTEHELLAIVGDAERDALAYNGQFLQENQDLLERYLGEPYGDEVEGQSQVISTDVQDLIESDMPALVRVFLGVNDVITFEPQSSNPADEAEAEEKTKYVNWIIQNQEDSYKIIHDWIKDALMQKAGVLKVVYQEREDVREVEYDGLNEVELMQLVEDLQNEADKVEIIGQNENDDLTYYVQFKIRRKIKEFVLLNVPSDEFLISRNARSVETAALVGDRTVKTRSELIAEGFDYDTVAKLPRLAKSSEEGSGIRALRHKDSGGDDEDTLNSWASEEVELCDLYVQVDYDGDGIAERRHILKSGNV
ncbi:MAG: hypothetical protein R3183_13100, partial [Oleiphilaceae bacterium]|nr:hypothetical protein [Oleiphilaceae bacterium]